MSVRQFVFISVAIFGLVSLCAITAIAAEKPNVLIFYGDDLGWGELGCQGNNQIPTPNIDSIASNGVRFTQGYVAATYCSPSRAGLMTGRYPTRFGHEFNSIANVSGLHLKETTLADRLKSLGYATVCIGKWHLGNGMEYRPTKRGFDEFYGTLNNTPFYHPHGFVDSRESSDVKKITDDSFYTTDKYAERALDWLEKNKTKPWLLYLPFNAQHAPLEAPDKYLERFTSIAEKKRQIFAAMLSGMDDAVGRVLGKVREMGQEENTIIFYIADNGGPTNSTTSQNGGLRGFKTNTYEGGPRVPFMVQWKGKISAGQTFSNPVMNLDVLPTVVTAAGGTVDPAWKLDGVDLIPYLTGANKERPHETMYWRFGDQWAIRKGDMKLVVSHGGSGKPELYDLAADFAETKDLASTQPEKAKELQTLWDSWSAEQAEPASPKESPNKAAKKAKKKEKAG